MAVLLVSRKVIPRVALTTMQEPIIARSKATLHAKRSLSHWRWNEAQAPGPRQRAAGAPYARVATLPDRAAVRRHRAACDRQLTGLRSGSCDAFVEMVGQLRRLTMGSDTVDRLRAELDEFVDPEVHDPYDRRR